MQMRVVILAACVACSAPPGATVSTVLAGSADTYMLDAYVLDANGPVANAEVQVYGVKPRACPCTDVDASEHVERAFPECTCPEAAVMWRETFARCALSAPLAVVRADPNGHVAVPASPGATLHAIGPAGERWIAVPAQRSAITLELGSSRPPEIEIGGSQEQLRAAIVFADGHCAPLDHVGEVWVPRIPTPPEADAVIVAENAEGFTLWQIGELWVDREDVEEAHMQIFASRPVEGTCTANAIARLDGPFQHLTTPVDATGHFKFTHVRGFDAEVTCVDGTGAVLDRFAYDAWDDRVHAPINHDCNPVDVVDASGHPIEGADVQGISLARGPLGGGVSDARGRACASQYADELEVTAPGSRGGACAGHQRVRLVHAVGPLEVRLHVRELPRDRWSGRVVTKEHVPVPRAEVSVSGVELADHCRVSMYTITRTHADGTFELPELPRGKLELWVHHPWYLQRSLELESRAAPRELVVERGATWDGRLLDPDGHVIEKCKIDLEHSGGRAHGYCSRGRFALSVIAPGEAKLSIMLDRDHPLGSYRILRQTIVIRPGEHRHADIRWPVGEPIAGILVDSRGEPIAHERVVAAPKGTSESLIRDRPLDQDVVYGQSDDAGRFELRHLKPGPWTIFVGPNNYARVDALAGTRDLHIVAR